MKQRSPFKNRCHLKTEGQDIMKKTAYWTTNCNVKIALYLSKEMLSMSVECIW